MIEILLLACLAGLAELVGVYLAKAFSRRDLIGPAIGYSSGVMIAISLGELIPSALLDLSLVEALAAFAAGGALFWIADGLIPHAYLLPENKTGRLLKTGYLIAFGIILHDLPEGFAMASAYAASQASGVLVAIGIALHNIPEGIALAVPMLLARRHGALMRVAILAALAEPVGALMGIAFASGLPFVNPFALAFAAGAMVFVSFDELFPLACKYGKPWSAAMGFAMGALSFLAIARLFGA